MPFVIYPQSDALPLVTFEPHPAPANYRIVAGSPKGGSGKTSTMIFAATTLAAMGARVLVVEATEGQAALTHAYHPTSYATSPDGRSGLGWHLYQGLGLAGGERDYASAYARYRGIMDKEAPAALASLGKIRVSPDNDRTLDILPCGEIALERVQSAPAMQHRNHRRALLTAFLDALAAAHPDGGWDFIFLDTLPAVSNTITLAAMGVADSYSVVVDVESSHTLTGWGAISQELLEISREREEEGKDPNIFRGLILNKTGRASDRSLVERINRFLIACERKAAADAGFQVDILAEIPRKLLLTMLGFNYSSILTLSKRYGGALPEDLNTLTDEDVAAMYQFKAGADHDGQTLEPAAGVAWLCKANPGNRANYIQQAQELLPLLLSLANDDEAMGAYAQAFAPFVEV